MPWKTIGEQSREIAVILNLLSNRKKNKLPTRVSLLFRKAPTSSDRSRKTILRIRYRSFWKKSKGKCWHSNPHLTLQNSVVLHSLPWEPLEFLTNVSEIIKYMGEQRTEPRPTAGDLFLLSSPVKFTF